MVHEDPDAEGLCDPDLDTRGEKEGRGEVEGDKDKVLLPVPVPPTPPPLPEGVLDAVRVGSDAVPLFVGLPGVPEGLLDREGEVLKVGVGVMERDGRGEEEEERLWVAQAVLEGEEVAVMPSLREAPTDALCTEDPELKRGEGDPDVVAVDTLVEKGERVGENGDTVGVLEPTGQRLGESDMDGVLVDNRESVPPRNADPVGATDMVTEEVVD